MRTSVLTILSVATMGLLAGCGSSGDSTSNLNSTNSGVFIDSAVSGLNYKCSSGGDGITDSFGRFTCQVGDIISFNINGFYLGSSILNNTITPRDLYKNNDKLSTSIAQLLQTLDSDSNVDNGISLDSNSFAILALKDASITLDQADFTSEISSYIGMPLIGEAIANNHLDLSIKNIENAAAGLSSLSTVVVMNGIDEPFCTSLLDSQVQTFEGFNDYEDFITQGGSQSISYLSSSRDCNSYDLAGFCEVQDFSQVLGGSGSCVQEITFPFVPGQGTPEPVNTTEIDPNTYLTVYKPMLSNLRSDNIYFEGNAYNANSTINLEYQSMTANEKVADTLYSIGGNPLYGYEAYTDTYTATTLTTQFYDSQMDYTNEEGSWNIRISGNIHTKENENKNTKFSNLITPDTLHQMYLEVGLDINFTAVNKAQFMITSNSDTYAHILLVMNESAYLKVIEAFTK